MCGLGAFATACPAKNWRCWRLQVPHAGPWQARRAGPLSKATEHRDPSSLTYARVSVPEMFKEAEPCGMAGESWARWVRGIWV